jgi:hypothetical protein
VDGLVESIASAGPTNVFLVGCSGSLFSFGPVRAVLDRAPFPVFAYNSDELVLHGPAVLGPCTTLGRFGHGRPLSSRDPLTLCADVPLRVGRNCTTAHTLAG